MMHGLYYADEVRSFDDIELDSGIEFKKGELDLATQLIEQLGHDEFEPEKYEDGYRQSVLELVDRKVSGEEVVSAPRAESPEKIIDLVAALKQSLADRGDAPAAGGRKPAKAKGKTTGSRRKAASR